jgi:hypothetical protein
MKTKFFSTLALFCFAAMASAQSLSNYQATIIGQSPVAYYKLGGDLNDAMGGLALTPGGLGGLFITDAFRTSSNAYAFLNADDRLEKTVDIIDGGGVTNATAAGKGTIALLFRALDGLSTGQRYLFSQGTTNADGNALSLFFDNVTNNGALKLRVGNVTSTILSSNSINFDGWYYFAMSYDEARDAGEVQWYLGGIGDTLNSGTMNIDNEAVVGDNGTLFIGNQISLGGGFRSPGRGRIDEFAVWTNELSGVQISNQFSKLPAALPTGVPYQDVVAAERPNYYFKLDGEFGDSVGGVVVAGTNGVGGTFTTNVLGIQNAAYGFNGSDDALLITNDIVSGGGSLASGAASGVGTISLLFRTLSDVNTGQRWIFSQGTNNSAATRNALNLFLENTNISNGDPNSLKLRAGNTTTTILPAANLVSNSWYFFAMTFDELRNQPEVRWYAGRVGGVLTNGIFDPANDSLMGDDGIFYLGNRIGLNLGFRNPGSGAIDEFATWNDELSVTEVTALFNAITNAVPVVQPPTLAITLAAPNVLITWPSSTSPAYALESATNLTTSPWASAGPPTVVGSENVVTNAAVGSEKYYRLRKP